jgi:RimJ/RimL family protein N-acetyltransferase
MIPGKLVRLRPIEKSDLRQFVQWFGDPEFRWYVAMYNPISMDQEERWFEQSSASPDTQPWAIEAPVVEADRSADSEKWELIGSCGFHTIDWRNRSGEVGIMIGPKNYWDRGYGTDAMRTLVSWGFDNLNLNRIHLRVYADNARAIRSYEKVGFKLEGRLREDDFREGQYRDSVIMAILQREWRVAR